MTYSVSLDFWIDENESCSNEEIIDALEELLEGTAYGVSNIKVLDIND